MDPIYPQFAAAGSPFYDKPGRHELDSSQDYRTDRALARLGWLSQQDDHWIHWTAPGITVPEQGWKVHVSATLGTASEALRQASAYCRQQRVAFKHLRSPSRLRASLAKDADRISAAKFITIYPTDDQALQNCLTTLQELLSGHPAPHILTDLRWDDGPLFVRYGAFIRQFVDVNGFQTPAIRDPRTGQLVPDVRGTTFTCPAWVTIPAFLQAQLDALELAPPKGFPHVTGALHHSNAGGIYTATMGGKEIVLKEARPHTGLTPDDRDAVSRLQDEETVLKALIGRGYAPRPLATFIAHGHRYLAMEHIEGDTLSNLVVARHPLASGTATPSDYSDYRSWVLGISASLRAVVTDLHRSGHTHGDLHPGNILVTASGDVRLIDFEMSVPTERETISPFGVPGFVAPDGRSARDADLYALACIDLHMFLPLTPLAQQANQKLHQLVEVAAEQFDLGPGWAEEVLRTLSPRTSPGAAREHRKTLGSLEFTRPRGLDAAITGIVHGISVDADPTRADRLWPGDPRQFREPAFGLASGALGVASAAALTGRRLRDAELLWIQTALRETTDLKRPGLMDGIAGAIWGLRQLGLDSDAAELLQVLRSRGWRDADCSLYSGLPGVGLTLLSFASSDATAVSQAAEIVRQLDEKWKTKPTKSRVATDRGGLLRGATGTALLALAVYEHTRDTSHLESARRALDHDLATLAVVKDGSLHVNEGWRVIPYLGHGSAGVGVVLARYISHTGDAGRYKQTLDAIVLAASTPFTVQAGLLRGRAGLIHALILLDRFGLAPSDVRSIVDHHVSQLALYAFPDQRALRFAGDGLLRMSCDLGSGSAGVLTALLAYREWIAGGSLRWSGLPYLAPDSLMSPSPRELARGGEINGVPLVATGA
ncbi:class III lanthionine synthetase LanKC [Microbacterium fluvii]|uniref:Class III lanthionine synthetase LanKC n=1 Tax=Microbacterium fluvii TaxID=415215 RepID=A0ABW2HG42_9MICO|nr:class III lanthionine synthetase LanKC [Microbacterium fluvii]MCU4673750.1 class III lanthionine synthetase LanKC [Microbacterium fluvii]